jgi:two-component system, LytTR family, response regulator
MVKCLIIDDEKNSRENLENLIGLHCKQIVVCGRAKSGAEGLSEIDRLNPDAIFLDVHMTDMDGFTMLSKMTDAKPMVVFVTAYEKYALRAIKASAIDYILKPVSIRELQSAAVKLEQLHQLREESSVFDKGYNDALKMVLLNNQDSYPKRIALPDHAGYRFENMDNITHLDSDSNYTTIHLKNGEKIVASKPMKHFEDILDEKMFVRIHNSHIINILYLKNYSREDGGSAELHNGTIIQISKRRLPLFLAIVKDRFIKP